ncbi:hypothetical protein HY218_01870 [Candidatus Saccharibacteria bacterium]|nr:hypothetical protein [Candidatus Saccharibacteria bacterium]
MSNQATPPYLDIEPSADEATSEFLTAVEAGINRNPRAYHQGLELFELATSRRPDAAFATLEHIIGYLRRYPEDTDDVEAAFDHWQVLFRDRLDRGAFKFDPATEAYIKGSPEMADVDQRAREKRWTPEETRDQKRLTRAALFVGRVAAKKAANPAPSKRDRVKKSA